MYHFCILILLFWHLAFTLLVEMPLLTVYRIAISRLCFKFISGMVCSLKLELYGSLQHRGSCFFFFLFHLFFFLFFVFSKKSLVVLHIDRKISLCYR